MSNSPLLSVSEARNRILNQFEPKNPIRILVRDAVGCVLAADIHSPMESPPFDNSSMDGFAIQSKDSALTNQTQPVSLTVVGDIPAGKRPHVAVQSGQAARIMTGAQLPVGADAVIPVELTSFSDRYNQAELPASVEIYQPIQAGENVRPAGQDIQKGQLVFSTGHYLKPHDLGFLAGMGIFEISTYSKPRIALFSSGDELVPPGQALGEGQVYDINSLSIATLLRSFGAEVIELGVAADTYASVQALLRQAVDRHVDIIVSTAGVSMGAFDFVKRVVEDNGSLNFWKVNMRPGKPLTFGSYTSQSIPFIGLPGNPVSAYVGSRIFIRPIIYKLLGKSPLEKFKEIELGEDIESDGRESYLRVRIDEKNGRCLATLAQHQGSGNMYSLVCANALLIIPAGVKSLAKGSRAKTISI